MEGTRMTKEEWAEREKDQRRHIYDVYPGVKESHWNTFAKCIERQFENGSGKYALSKNPYKEITDLACELSPGISGVDHIMQNIVEYAGRFVNLQRESDLLKIATYAFIAWIKKGYHLKSEHEEDLDGFVENE